MDSSLIIGILSIIICSLFLFFSVFLLSVKTEKKLSNILLALFLIITALDISVFFYTFLFEVDLTLDMLRNRLSDLKSPLIFLYILSVIYSNFKLKPIHAVHLLPWVIGLLVLSPNFFFVTNEMKVEFSKNYNSNAEIIFLRNFGRLLSLVYFSAEVYYLLRYRKLLLENYTDKGYFKNYNWLKQLIILMFIGSVLTLIKGIIRDNEFSKALTQSWRIITLAFGVFFVFWLIFKALLSPKLFRGIDVNLNTSKEIKATGEKSENKDQIQILKDFMKEEEPYLNPSLSIRNLADQLKIPMRDLSVLINQDLKQHFFDFINEYRIEKAKNILKDSSKNKLTILETLYEVGFNSKSSFNTAFKKHTGKTPTQFRKSEG